MFEQLKSLIDLMMQGKFADAESLLDKIDFSNCDITKLSSRDNHPLWQALMLLPTTYAYKIIENCPDYDELLQLIHKLRAKGFKLPLTAEFRFTNEIEAVEEEEKLFDCYLKLSRCLYAHDEKNGLEHEQQFMEALKKTQLYQRDSHYVSEPNYFNPQDFQGSLQHSNPTHFKAAVDYFINVAKLFSDPKLCLGLLTDIDKEIASVLPELTPQNHKPDHYLWCGIQSYPMPSDEYKHRSKGKQLMDIIARQLYGDLPHQIPGKYFYHTVGFIDTPLAIELLNGGEFFIEKGYSVYANTSGAISHILQWLILVKAHEQGILTIPDGFNMLSILQLSINKEAISCCDHLVWGAVFDQSFQRNFTSPSFLSSTIMNPIGEECCPHLCAYWRNHFWRCYEHVTNSFRVSAQALCAYDILAAGEFGDPGLAKELLLAHYRENGNEYELHPHSLAHNSFLFLKKPKVNNDTLPINDSSASIPKGTMTGPKS